MVLLYYPGYTTKAFEKNTRTAGMYKTPVDSRCLTGQPSSLVANKSQLTGEAQLIHK